MRRNNVTVHHLVEFSRPRPDCGRARSLYHQVAGPRFSTVATPVTQPSLSGVLVAARKLLAGAIGGFHEAYRVGATMFFGAPDNAAGMPKQKRATRYPVRGKSCGGKKALVVRAPATNHRSSGAAAVWSLDQNRAIIPRKFPNRCAGSRSRRR